MPDSPTWRCCRWRTTSSASTASFGSRHGRAENGRAAAVATSDCLAAESDGREWLSRRHGTESEWLRPPPGPWSGLGPATRHLGLASPLCHSRDHGRVVNDIFLAVSEAKERPQGGEDAARSWGLAMRALLHRLRPRRSVLPPQALTLQSQLP